MAFFTKPKINTKGLVDDEIKKSAGVARRGVGMVDFLSAEKSYHVKLSPYLPHEMIGGSLPYIAGTEDEAVWNAASQACGTEKVHYCYVIDGKRIWYLACPSYSLASAPDSWCPLAAALPGGSEYWDKETVYIFEHEGMGSALRWDPETGRMQVFIGATRTLLPRIQSMDANFVTINPEAATPVPWKNRQMNSERLARISAFSLVLVGMALNILIFLILAFQFILTNFAQRDLTQARIDTEKASNDLMINAYNALQSDAIKHFVRVQQLLDQLQLINGTLVKYQVDGGTMTWEAYVPQAYGAGTGTIQGEVTPGIAPDGRVLIKGNQ